MGNSVLCCETPHSHNLYTYQQCSFFPEDCSDTSPGGECGVSQHVKISEHPNLYLGIHNTA